MKTGSTNNTDNNYIPSIRAAQLSGYSQDYVGQLCRNGNVECKRVSGEWQVSLSSLLAYKKRFNPEVAITPAAKDSHKASGGHQDTVIDGGKVYVSSGSAAKCTGYSQDYIGQLARSGAVPAKKVGRKWFIEQEALEQHKRHNDGLLAAVQVDSVGLQKEGYAINKPAKPAEALNTNQIPIRSIPSITYKRDDGSLVPGIVKEESAEASTAAASTPSPEVTLMPAAGTPRQDLREGRNNIHNEIARYSPEHRSSSPMQKSSLGQTEQVSIQKSMTHTTSKVIVFLIIIASLLSIGFSTLAPERAHKFVVIIAGSVGLTITNTGIIVESTVGKEILSLMSAKEVYHKGM